MNESRQCRAITKKTGEQCGGWALRDSDFCYFHSDGISDFREQANQRGGELNAVAIRVSGEGAPVVTKLVDCLALVNAAIGELWAQHKNSPSRARGLLAASAEAREILRTSDFEERLARLEELLEKLMAGKSETLEQ